MCRTGRLHSVEVSVQGAIVGVEKKRNRCGHTQKCDRQMKARFLLHFGQFITLFFAGLYLFGFGYFHVPDALGRVDALLPCEWVACIFCGCVCEVWSVFRFRLLVIDVFGSSTV